MHDFKLRILQFQDHLTFSTLRSRIHLYDAKDVLLPVTILNGNLARFLEQDGCNILPTPRRNFNESDGLLLLNKLALHSGDDECLKYARNTSSSSREIAQSGYLALAAASAVIHHTENVLGLALVPNSLIVQVISVSGHMVLDLQTARRLRIVPTNPADPDDVRASLLGTLNFTKTSPGQRLLRSSLLSPLTDDCALATRAQLVQYLMATPHALAALHAALHAVATGGNASARSRRLDTEAILLVFASTPTAAAAPSDAVRAPQRLLGGILALRDFLTSVLRLRAAYVAVLPSDDTASIASSDSGTMCLLRQLAAFVSDDVITEPLAALAAVVECDSPPYGPAARGRGHLLELHQLNSILPGTSAVLDVARSVAVGAYEAAAEYVAGLADTIPGAALKYHHDRGFYIEVVTARKRRRAGDADAVGDAAAPALDPRLFLRQVQRASVMTCTTDPLLALSARFSSAHAEAMALCESELRAVVDTVRRVHLARIYALLDSVAFIDFVAALAAFGVALGDKAGVPVTFAALVDDDIALTRVYNPIMLATRPAESVVPVTLSVDTRRGFVIVSGPNSSGKTALLHTLGVLCVLIQVGACVPGIGVRWRVCDAILSRLDFGDSVGARASSFVVELEDCADIIDRLCRRALILCDELGRGTHFVDGVGVAWAVCEKILAARDGVGAVTAFTTHFPSLSLLAARHPDRVDLVQLDVAVHHDASAARGVSTTLVPRYTISPGHCSAQRYGIAMARQAGLPASVVDAAERHAVALAAASIVSPEDAVAARRVFVAQQLYRLATSCATAGPAVDAMVQRLRALVV